MKKIVFLIFLTLSLPIKSKAKEYIIDEITTPKMNRTRRINTEIDINQHPMRNRSYFEAKEFHLKELEILNNNHPIRKRN